MKTKRLAVNGFMSALCAVLGFYALDMLSIKITFESIPILIGALLFGPIDGALIGGVGTLISQIVRYGLSATTFLWMLPYIVCGFVVGFVSRQKQFNLKASWVIPTIILAELLVTGINTFALFVDSKIYGYYYPELITGMLLIRIIISIVKSVIYGFIFMPVLTRIQKGIEK